MLTLRVPSFVAAMTTLFRESVTMPQMALSLSFALTVPCIRAITSGGRSPMSRDFRLKPDCMFHTRIAPVDVPARPKFPQAVTQTAWIDVHYSQRIGEGDACITKDNQHSSGRRIRLQTSHPPSQVPQSSSFFSLYPHLQTKNTISLTSCLLATKYAP